MINVTGESGFLLSNLDIDFSEYLVQFGSPIDSNSFENCFKLVSSVADTLEFIRVSNRFNKKLIFASSEAVLYDSDLYADCKREQENLIITKCHNYLIYRIPRVYDKTRKSGLMKTIRENQITNPNMKLEYITLSEFQDWVKQTIHIQNQILEVSKHHKATIKQISEWILS